MKRLSDTIRRERCPKAAAVILGGGSGTRFGGDKLSAELGGIPVLARSLRAFEECGMISEIVVVCREEMLNKTAILCRNYRISKLRAVVPGGATRLLSSYAGIMSVSPEAELIAIHDGARPLVTEAVIRDALWTAYRHIAAVPAIPVKDTVKRARNGEVTETPDRRELFAVQTPQCFQRDVIMAAVSEAVKNAPDVTDDCMAVERIGGKIFLTEGSEENLKITTPLDLNIGELILKRRQS